MDDIVNWLSHIEEKVAGLYRNAAELFAADSNFKEFLNTLALQEMQHAQIIRTAFSERSPIKVEEIATTIDEDTQQMVIRSLDTVSQKIACGITRDEMAAIVADIEFLEWNGIFLYAMNVLKGDGPEYLSAVAEIEKHLKTVEDYLSTFSSGREILEIIHRIPSLNRLRVLVVEDDPSLANLIKNILMREAGVELACNGKEGLERLAHEAFDVIVSDVEMPVMDGISMFKEVVRRENSLRERFVFLTASNRADYLRFFAEQGLPVLRKPSPINRIRQAVIGVSKRRRIQDGPVGAGNIS